eukprot:GHVU01091864.1.p1 GENE.GHVU01091864.1~~GHVU01091864.1.p1  ORF type:complete len:193 (+),score=30.88 GHVU01091864.1:86-580(+)
MRNATTTRNTTMQTEEYDGPLIPFHDLQSILYIWPGAIQDSSFLRQRFSVRLPSRPGAENGVGLTPRLGLPALREELEAHFRRQDEPSSSASTANEVATERDSAAATAGGSSSENSAMSGAPRIVITSPFRLPAEKVPSYLGGQWRPREGKRGRFQRPTRDSLE